MGLVVEGFFAFSAGCHVSQKTKYQIISFSASSIIFLVKVSAFFSELNLPSRSLISLQSIEYSLTSQPDLTLPLPLTGCCIDRMMT